MNRQQARYLGHDTYRRNRRCPVDGTFICYTKDARCVECAAYASAIKRGRIDGVNGNGNDRTVKDKWSEEMRIEHSAAIKRGLARRKATKFPPPR